ncbi:MAG TPA: hypothetical protein VMM12_03515 [Longimicrobiales bacterium]|nr:hypothetical protein [Longimicrobiales bacterium]
MWNAEGVVSVLRRRGELLEPVPGVAGLRGGALALFEALDTRVADLCRRLAAEPWRPPAALAWGTLEDADYFASFPQWLTAASHLGDDEGALETVAASEHPAAAARGRFQPAAAALPPAVCYHVFEALRGARLERPRRVTAQCTCWRHEGSATRALERGWSFTMREVVALGDAGGIAAFRTEGEAAALRLAAGLGLEARLEEAADPFFRPTARGKALVQQLKGLKREVTLPVGGGRRTAAASSNLHETFFGHAFGIRDGAGAPVSSGCLAFGLERWLLAFMVAHGPDAGGWPIRVAPRARQEAGT